MCVSINISLELSESRGSSELRENSCDAIGRFGVTEEVLASLFRDQTRGRERFPGSYSFATNLRFNLFTYLRVNGPFGHVLYCDVHTCVSISWRLICQTYFLDARLTFQFQILDLR